MSLSVGPEPREKLTCKTDSDSRCPQSSSSRCVAENISAINSPQAETGNNSSRRRVRAQDDKITKDDEEKKKGHAFPETVLFCLKSFVVESLKKGLDFLDGILTLPSHGHVVPKGIRLM